MSDQITVDLRAFKYMSRLDFPGSDEQIYRLLYPTTTRYLCYSPASGRLQLLDQTGEVSAGEHLIPLHRKVRAYERIAAGALDREYLEHFLRINEAEFLLNELAISQPQLESRLYRRLKDHVAYQIKKKFYDELLLPRFLERNEFIGNYLQTNIGHPDSSENYFNKLREMIQQINEQTEFVEVNSYFDVITVLIRYVAGTEVDTPNTVISTYQNYCILLGGFNTLEPGYHHFFRRFKKPPQQQTTVIRLGNQEIAELVKIYNELVYTRQ